jgi:hypothetical protein
MRWHEIQERLTKAFPISMSGMDQSGPKKALPLTPVVPAQPDPATLIAQALGPAVQHAAMPIAQLAASTDDEQEQQMISAIMASRQPKESSADRESAKKLVKQKYSTK